MLEELEMADTREQEAAAAFWGQILFIFASLDSSTNEDIEQISSQWFLNFFFQGEIVNGETCKAERDVWPWRILWGSLTSVSQSTNYDQTTYKVRGQIKDKHSTYFPFKHLL